MVCTSVQACLKFSHSLSRTIVPRGIGAAAARRQPADGLNNRRRENEVEGKKKGERPGVIPLLVCFVIHRDIAESLLTEVSMILVGEKDSTRAWPIMCEAGCLGFPPYSVQVWRWSKRGIDVFSIPRQSDIIRV